ncbi:morphogenetic protein [Klebsiella pneumoniae]|nr:morphogenetic protein [Klebsiella pneumoniae]VAR60602.1 morphogenetic protein [Klebsiella pneumoniae]
MIFNGEMVRALLDGRKTQTRRIVKGTDSAVKFCKEWNINGEEVFVVLGEKDHTGMNPVLGAISCPFGAVGNRIWVREAFRVHSRATDVATLVYKASERNSWTEQTHRVPVAVCNKPATPEKWTPSLHMPRWASRILLEITDVRVERLNAINEHDAQAEGVAKLRGGFWKHYQPGWTQHQLSARGSFVTLWKSIYGDESWNSNPWVWVIKFKRIEVLTA